MPRVINQREVLYDPTRGRFEATRSDYHTNRRIQVLIDEFLTDEMIQGKHILDVGSGLGYFSKRLVERGGVVTACDVGPGLVEKTREHAQCDAVVADACSLVEQFGESSFDVVVSSDCIEHTPSPRLALREMAAVVKPDGYLVISTPNVLWSPIFKLATKLKLRPSDGLENFSSWPGIRDVLEESRVHIVRQKGIHLFPFDSRAHRLSKWCDENLQMFRTAMLNICIIGRKESETIQRLTDIEKSLAAVFGEGTV